MTENQSLPNARGFIGSAVLLTSWGGCRLHDLARCTGRRDEALNALAQRVSNQQHADTVALREFAATSEKLIELAADEDRVALTQIHAELEERYRLQREVFVDALRVDAAEKVAEFLPMIAANATVPLQGVTLEPETAIDFVDVVVWTSPTVEYSLTLRCTPNVMFVTKSGDAVEAAKLQGVEILRVLADGNEDTFVVPSVTAVVLDGPVPVYRPRADATACCMGADATVFAVVLL